MKQIDTNCMKTDDGRTDSSKRGWTKLQWESIFYGRNQRGARAFLETIPIILSTLFSLTVQLCLVAGLFSLLSMHKPYLLLPEWFPRKVNFVKVYSNVCSGSQSFPYFLFPCLFQYLYIVWSDEMVRVSSSLTKSSKFELRK